MIRGLRLALVVVCLSCPAWLQAGDAYTVQLKEAKEGTSCLVIRSQVTVNRIKLVGDPTKVKEMVEKESVDFVYRETVVEKPEEMEKPICLKRHYEKAQVNTDGLVKALPYEGKTVIIQEKGGDYGFRIEGGEELTGDVARFLEEEFADEGTSETDPHFLKQYLLPHKAVRANHTWMIRSKELVNDLEALGFLLDASAVPGTGKLVRTYRQDGHQFGMFEVHLSLPIKGMKDSGLKLGSSVIRPETEIPVKMGSRLNMALNYDVCIDGSTQSRTTQGVVRMRISGKMPIGPNAEDDAIFTHHCTSQETRKELSSRHAHPEAARGTAPCGN